MSAWKQITPCLWFEGNAEEAVKFYTSVFKNSKIGKISRYSEAGKENHGQKPGSVMTVEFEINGQTFLALNGGPQFKFTEAISLMVPCKDQKEIDYYWEALTADGGEESVCGWLKDKFGLSWQIVPENIGELIADPNRSERVMTEVMKMTKLDIAKLKAA